MVVYWWILGGVDLWFIHGKPQLRISALKNLELVLENGITLAGICQSLVHVTD
jgi:hypothetical protein